MSQSRQLAAIMFTDIVGYTALMGKNEQKAFELLNKNRQIQKPIIEHYSGRWIKELGDGILATFPTDSDAVNAAIKIQEACNNSQEFFLRIGIHQGEVVFEGDDVFGDAVNIASRIQAIAEPGGIFVSESVHNNVSNKQGIETLFVKQETLKNVKEPVRIYKVIPREITPDAVTSALVDFDKLESIKRKGKKKTTLSYWLAGTLIMLALGYLIYNNFRKPVKNISHPDTDKSIAVLSFVNMSNDKDQEYFSDGLSEELLNLLAKIPELKVIGRTSSFSFKGKNEDLRSIAQKLGVAHLLEGSVRKDGNKIRVSAQLIKASDGSHIWSETYDRNLEDIFKMQDEIASAVVKQLKIKLFHIADTAAYHTANSDVYNLLLQGNYFLEKRDKENLARALDLYLQALAVDSLNSRSWTALAKCYNLQAQWNWIDRNQGFKKAENAATKAVALENDQSEAHRVLGEIKMYNLDWNAAEAEFQKALDIEPANADILRDIGFLHRSLGRFDEAIRLSKQSVTLDPIKAIAYFNLGQALYYANHLEEAIINYKKVLELNPQFPRAHIFLGKVYLLQGKFEAAMNEMAGEPDEAWKIFGLLLTYQALGRENEVEKLLSDYIVKFSKNNAYQIAEILLLVVKKTRLLNGWKNPSQPESRDLHI